MSERDRKGGAPSAAELLAECLDLTERAAEMARGYFRSSLGVAFKSDDSPVTQADQAIERLVRERIARKFPGHGIVGEEHGADAAGNARVWIIDPIDGTRSFITGHPLFGFLLAHLVDGSPEIGIISMPMLREVYTGVAGQGAALNGAPIRASNRAQIEDATIYVNEVDKIHAAHPQILSRLMAAGRTRRFGHDCYPYALLAAGHVDLVVDYDLQPYDFMALRPVVTEAGGILTDWRGQVPQLEYSGPVVAAATPGLHAQALALLRS